MRRPPAVHPLSLPAHLPASQSYERLLRQIISSRLFRTTPPAGGKGKAAPQPPLSKPSVRVAHDVQLRLVGTEAEATTLLQMQVELVRRPRVAGGKQPKGGGGKQAAAGEGGSGSGSGGAVAVLDELPDAQQILQRMATRLGPHETWLATVQIKGDAQRGSLKFQPLVLQRVGASHDTLQLAPDALHALLGARANATDFVIPS